MKKWWCKTTIAKSKQYLRWEAFFFRKITTLNSSGIFARNTRKDYSKGNKTVSLWMHTSPAASSWHQKMSMCSCVWKHTHTQNRTMWHISIQANYIKKKKKKGPTAISQILLHNSNAVGITTLFLIVVCLFVLSSRQISIIVTHIYNNNKQIQGNVFLHSQIGNDQTGNNLQ